jgi:hypothetical protein
MLRTLGDRPAIRPDRRAARHSQADSPTGGPADGGSRLLIWVARRMRSAGDRLFHADDQRAIARGWQVTPGRSGLSRTYRDRRFDGLAARSGDRGQGR